MGFTTAAFFANNGVEVICYDINPNVVKAINEGKPPPHLITLGNWLPFNLSEIKRKIHATSDYKEIKDVDANIIAVNTEKNGEPWSKALEDVVSKIKKISSGGLVIIESTIPPSWCKFVSKTLKDFDVAVAPRRDWYDDPTKTVATIPRVVGADTPEALEKAKNVLKVICEQVVPVSSCEAAALSKSVENTQRFLILSLAEELASAYPNVNVTEVLQASATKWNFLPSRPQIGIGGVCVPLAPQYLLEGATTPEELSTVITALKKWKQRKHMRTVASILKGKKVAILGLSYKRDVKVPLVSPPLELATYLHNSGNDVYVHDPYFSESEIKVGRWINYPEELPKVDAIVVGVGHSFYDKCPIEFLKKGTLVLDAEWTWNENADALKAAGIKYLRVGDKGWLELVPQVSHVRKSKHNAKNKRRSNK